MKKFFSIVVAAMLCTTMWAETVRVDIDGYPYDLDNSTHIAYLRDSYLPFPANISVPYIVTYLGVDYTVNLTRVQFNLIPGALEVSITLAEGHTWLSLTDNWMNLTTLQLPSTFQTLAGDALANCGNLQQIVCHASTPPAMAAAPSAAACANAQLCVPQASIEAYRAHAGWGMFANIVPISAPVGSRVEMDSIQYELNTESHIASVLTEQCFPSKTVIPYHITVDGIEYTVSIDETDFSALECNSNNVVSLYLAEGHTRMMQEKITLQNLQELYLPSTFTTRDGGEFDLPFLHKVTCRALTPPDVEFASTAMYENMTLYVPLESVDAYSGAAGWHRFSHIEPIEDSVEVNGIQYFLDRDSLIASMVPEQCLPTDVKIPYKIETDDAEYTVSVSPYSFSLDQCNYKNLSSIGFAEGHTHISIAPINYFTGLVKLTLPSTVTEFAVDFYTFPHLQKLICLATTPPYVPSESNISQNFYDSVTLYVPMQSVEAYHLDGTWGRFRHIVAHNQVEVDGIEYVLENNVAMVISDQCFPTPELEIVDAIVVDEIQYPVLSDSTDFSLMPCNRESLTSLSLGNGQSEIMPQSHPLTNLQELDLPFGFTNLRAGFSFCPNLRVLKCYAHTPPTVPSQPDSLQIYRSAALWVSRTSIANYYAHPEWGKFRHILPNPGSSAHRVTINGIAYEDLTQHTHVVYVSSDQCFSINTVIPYQINVDGEDYTVKISTTDFSYRQCAVDRMTSFTLSEGFEELGARQISGLTHLQNLFLPSTLTHLDVDFSEFSNLRKLTCLATTPPALRSTSGSVQAYDSAIVIVPRQSLAAYRAHTEWGKFRHIEPDNHITIDGIEYILDTMSHTASIPSKQCFPAPDLVIPYHVDVDGVEYTVSIDSTDFTLWRCNVDSLKSLRLEEGHTEIILPLNRFDGLRALYLPSTFRDLKSPFTRFPSLRILECLATTPPAVPSRTDWSLAYDSAIVYVPEQSIDSYRAHTEWGKFHHIVVLGHVEIDGVEYALDTVSHIASVFSKQYFNSQLELPYHVNVKGVEYTVSVDSTDFFLMPCNRDSLVSLRLGEGHTRLPMRNPGVNSLRSLYLPSTMQSIAGLGGLNSLRSLVCLAAEPPVLEDTTRCVAYDSATCYVPIELYRRYRVHPVWGRFREICPLGYNHIFEVSDTVVYHNTMVYAVSDSLGAMLFRPVHPVGGQGIVIPDSVSYGEVKYPVVSIADSAFVGVMGMQFIETPHRAPRCGNGCFRGWNKNTVVIVPEDSCVAAYRNASYWGDFSHIVGRRQAGDTIAAEYYYQGGKPYQLFYRVLPDRRSLRLVRPTGGYTDVPNKAAELNNVVLDKKLVPYRPIEIGDSVLAGCTHLERFSLNAGIRRIGNGLLSGCTGLKSISVDSANTEFYSPESTNGIVRRSDHVLLWGSLSSQVSDSVRAIGDEAFAGLPLTRLRLPASITSIGAHAFRDCPLEITRLLGAEPAALADNAFEGVDSAMVVFVPRTACDAYRTHPDWKRFAYITPWYEVGDTIAQHHAAGAYTSAYTLYYRVLDESSLELMAPTYRLEDGLAAGVVDLTDTLAFRFVVTQLATGALRGCRDVYTVHLGEAVTSLGDSVFYGCSQLNHIICDALVPPAAVRATFDGMDLSARVDVPAGMHDIYKEADGWKYFYCFNPVLQDPDPDPAGKPGSEMGLEDLLSADEAVKVVMDGHVWIIRDGVLYDLLGHRR